MKNRIVLSNLSDTTDDVTGNATLAELDAMFSELKRMEDALSNLRAFVRTVDGA